MASHVQKRTRESVPGTLNLVLAVCSVAGVTALLWLASHTESWLLFAVVIVAFSFLNNTIFSLLHESVHGVFHHNRTINESAGRILAAFFPTGFTLQRYAHLGHHRRNRSEHELFDYYRPGENLVVKYLEWYGVLTGVYWLLPPLSSLLFLITPNAAVRRIIDNSETNDIAHQTGATGMLSGYSRAPFGVMRLEILLTLSIQIALFFLLDLSLLGWAACYAAFALNWSSLQYTDHAFSERDVYDGAWNLRVNKLVQWIFLNYHHHLAHHQHPTVPWLYLGNYVDTSKYRPRFFSIYTKMWAGPRPLPEEAEQAVSSQPQTVELSPLTSKP